MKSKEYYIKRIVSIFSVNEICLFENFSQNNINDLLDNVVVDDVLYYIFSCDDYFRSAVRSLYSSILDRGAEPEGVSAHAPVYKQYGWMFCAAIFFSSEEFWTRKGGANAKSFLSAVWRRLVDREELSDLNDLAVSLESGVLSRQAAVETLLSRPGVVEAECKRLRRRLTGTFAPVPESVLAAFANGGREEAIRAICNLFLFPSAKTREGEAVGSELNPYRNRPPHTYWKYGVLASGARVDPLIGKPLSLSPSDPIATAGSCFSQRLSKALAGSGYHYMVTESYRPQPGVIDEGYGVFSARYGNIYTSRQLLQLFERAYGLRVPHTEFWHGKEGGFIDPFRPRIQANGFPGVELLLADRERHYQAVRHMFEHCRAFIFTLGLTETWISSVDGSAYPLAPGVVAGRLPDDDVKFHNLSVGEITSDLGQFLTLLSGVNPNVRVILTVSPVPIIATFEERHALVSNTATKSILRAAADEVCRRHAGAIYFPSYEMMLGPQAGSVFFKEDMREITDEGVEFVMSTFYKHFLSTDSQVIDEAQSIDQSVSVGELAHEDIIRYKKLSGIICDEEAILK